MMGSNGNIRCTRCNCIASFAHMDAHLGEDEGNDLRTTERITALMFRVKMPAQQIHSVWT
jgi:hypothetical protein